MFILTYKTLGWGAGLVLGQGRFKSFELAELFENRLNLRITRKLTAEKTCRSYHLGGEGDVGHTRLVPVTVNACLRLFLEALIKNLQGQIRPVVQPFRSGLIA